MAHNGDAWPRGESSHFRTDWRGCSKHSGGHTVKAGLGAHAAAPQPRIYSGTLAGPLTLVPTTQMTPSPHSPSESHDIS